MTMQVVAPKFFDLLREMADRKNAWQYRNGTLVRKDAASALKFIKGAEATVKALQDRIDILNSSLECEKRMRKDAEEDQERYRHVRRLSPRAFTEIHMRNIDGEGLFDDLIDQDMEMRAEAIRATFPKEAT